MEYIHQMQPSFGSEEAQACYNYMNTGGWVTEHIYTRKFEQMICDYVGVKYCHIVNNGTISLSIALLAIGIVPGDIVLVPDLTMIATPNSIKLLGSIPLFVDVDKETGCINIDHIEKLLNDPKYFGLIKAVIHVSLNTRCNDIERLKKLCEKHEIYLIEDSAQSLGSKYKGKYLGTYGDIGSYSFSSPKIISTGQGGCLITNNKKLSETIYKLKNFGRTSDGIDIHDSFGINSKTTDLQSVIGIEQMKKLPYRVKRIKEIWELYYKKLHNRVKMFEKCDEEWIPWFIDIYIKNPKKMQEYLKKHNIGSRLVYSRITSQIIYYKEDINPISDMLGKTGLWLPSSTLLTDEQINYICETIIYYIDDGCDN
jgi:perosamine synthetase